LGVRSLHEEINKGATGLIYILQISTQHLKP